MSARDFWDGDAEWEVPDIDESKLPTAEEMETILREKREQAKDIEDLFDFMGG